MEKYVILADVTCDLSEEMRSFCGMDEYINGYIHIDANGIERDFKTMLDWSLISCDEYYKLLADKKAKISTAPPTFEYFQE